LYKGIVSDTRIKQNLYEERKVIIAKDKTFLMRKGAVENERIFLKVVIENQYMLEYKGSNLIMLQEWKQRFNLKLESGALQLTVFIAILIALLLTALIF
jgi:hypothetical protein